VVTPFLYNKYDADECKGNNLRKLRDLNGKLRLNRKAVSPVIAVLLMIAIAVAAAILVYVWSMGLIGTLQTGGGSQTREQIELDAYDWGTTGSLKLYLRNVGASDIIVDAVYVQGVSMGSGMDQTLTVQGPVKLVTVAISGITETPGVAYTIKVVTLTGGVFTFSCIAGRGA
jgi:flagellin-like protein